MKFGISFLPDATPETKSAAEYFDHALALSVLADELGLGAVKMTEHYMQGYGGYCPSPLAFLSAVAARTRSIRLMTGCVLPAFTHPMKLAAEAAMVDALSHGRLDIGFARAYLPYEFDCFGVDMDTSRERFEATVTACLRLWNEPTVTLETPFFRLDRASLLPRPVQRPHPPVLVAAVRSRQSFAWIGEQGFGLLVTSALTPPDALAEQVQIYRDAYTAPANAPDRMPRVVISLPLLIAPSDAEAFDLGDRHLAHYHQVWATAAESWNTAQSRDYPGYTGLVRAIRGLTPEHARNNGHAIVGSPGRVVDDIHRLVEALDVDDIIWQIDFGAMALAPARHTLVSFIEDVVPHLDVGFTGTNQYTATEAGVSA